MPTTKNTSPYVGQRASAGVYVSLIRYVHKSSNGKIITEAWLTLSDGTSQTVTLG